MSLYVYGDYYQTYYAMRTTRRQSDVDKLLALPDLAKPEQLGTKLQALPGYRAQAMLYGSGDKNLQTPDAYTKAKDAAAQGLQAFSQWQKPQGRKATTSSPQVRKGSESCSIQSQALRIGFEGLQIRG